MYTKRNIKLITKITINSIFTDSKNDISSKFWYRVFNKNFLNSFLRDKYIPFKLKNKTLTPRLLSDIKFILSKIDSLKDEINLIEKDFIKTNDVFFSYLIFEKILGYYSDYYSDSFIKLSLLVGMDYSYDTFNETSLAFEEIEKKFLNGNNKFIQDLIIPLFETVLQDDTLYTLKIFWPKEIVSALIFGKLIKKSTKNSKIILDISEANEQFDYTQWSLLIKDNYKFLSNYLDFFVLYRDFGDSGSKLLSRLNGDENVNLSNIISIEKGNLQEYAFNKEHISSNIEKFFKTSFNKDNIHKLFGKNFLYTRMFPYKCYWSKCNFCTINSQNTITYDNNFGYDIFIDKWISFIKENDIYHIIFGDEALPPTQILKFAKKLIENNINIVYQFRTRFDKFYTREVCETLFKSGARYCGIGLESGSERINEDIGNKGEKHISLKDKLNIIKNFDNSGVSFHNYSIMGFPTEKENETMLTYKFLSKNIAERNFYTCTPNIFGLMKGSFIFNNLEKYGIVIDEKYLKNLINLSFEFNYSNGEKRNLNLYSRLSEQIHKEQFLPWLLGNDNVSARGFWNYIDRSSYFYKIKIIFRKSPFFEYRDINKEILGKDINEILNSYFEVSKYIQELDLESGKKYFYEYINMIEFWLSDGLKDFFKDYDETLTLQENIDFQKINLPEDTIIFLLENRILLSSKKD